MADRQGLEGALTYDPGKDAAERYPGWVIRHRDLRGIPEVLCLDRRVILVDRAQDWPAKRSGLAHAIAHLDLDHRPATGRFDRRQEKEAEELAARRLLPTAALADAIRWCGEDVQAIAEHMMVDVRLVRARTEAMFGPELMMMRRELQWMGEVGT